MQRIMKLILSGAAALALTIAIATPRAYADADDHREHCQRAVEKAEYNLDHAIRKHGERSRQADERRHQLNEQRERCWNENHAWYNAREHRWETERNWDRDHDRDDDRH